MAELRDVLTEPAVRKKVIDDACRLLDQEVSRKGGMSGLAIKAGYKTFKTFKPGIVPAAVDHLLDDFADACDPYYQEWLEKGGSGSIKRVMVPRKSDVAESLLAITDGKAERAEKGLILKTYRKLRPMAKRHTEEAVPGVCGLIDRYIRED